ncbi:MAG: hypothetical protein MUF21_14195 [Gemmatimonadaceae bacterium]|nr:hypothetical protein [Gemmatimonadaceae bacterium]
MRPPVPDDDALPSDDPLAAHLTAFRAPVAVRDEAVLAVKEAVRADALPVATPPRVAPVTAHEARGIGRAAAWLATPRALRLSPLAAAALLIAIAGAGGLLARGLGPRSAPGVAIAGGSPTAVVPASMASARVVRFTLTAPGARRVYGFVVDGSEWIADPQAPQAETDFGAPNSVLVVGT